MADLYYRFKNVSIEQFATLSNKLQENVPIDYKTLFSFKYLKDENVLVSRAEVILLQEKELKMKTIFDCSFEIKKESIAEITQEDGSIVFTKNVLIQLASLNYGTLRGIVIEKTKGTSFSHIFLPPLVVGDIIKEDLIIPVKIEEEL